MLVGRPQGAHIHIQKMKILPQNFEILGAGAMVGASLSLDLGCLYTHIFPHISHYVQKTRLAPAHAHPSRTQTQFLIHGSNN